jgi:hypothetical protein
MIAALGVLLPGIVVAFANQNSQTQGSPIQRTPAPVGTPKALHEAPEIVTTRDIARYPAIYKDQRIELVGWGQGVFSWFGDAEKGDPRLDGCTFEILVGLSGGVMNGGALGCIDKLRPEQRSDFYRSSTCHTTFTGSVKSVRCRNNPLGSHPPPDTSLDSTAWNNVVVDEDVNLICTVKAFGLLGPSAMSLLTHCELSKSISRKAEEAMEEREAELEKQQEAPQPPEQVAPEPLKITVESIHCSFDEYRSPVSCRANAHTIRKDRTGEKWLIEKWLLICGPSHNTSDYPMCFSTLAAGTYTFDVREDAQLLCTPSHGSMCIEIHPSSVFFAMFHSK